LETITEGDEMETFWGGFSICYEPYVFQVPKSYGLKIIFTDFV
jgi:hypothetical protein